MAPPTTGRFAPSPTGELHLGNARTALLAWLWARAQGGRFVLRVEDLDAPRVRPGLAERQLEELLWLGLDWDEGPLPDGAGGFAERGPHGPYRQSLRAALYDAAIARLRAEGHVYDCFCSRAEIRAVASAPHGAGDEGPRYPGTCAQLSAAQASERRRTRAPALRLRVPPGPIAFDDRIAGPQAFDPQAEVGDFVLRRADGVHAYQLAVVVDDAAMGIGQVLRGADLLSSTSRQLLLYRLLGLPAPAFAHAPLVLGAPGPDGQPQRLSKRDRAVSLSALRADGADPLALVARLARSCGLAAPAEERLDPRALVERFSLAAIPRTPVILGS